MRRKDFSVFYQQLPRSFVDGAVAAVEDELKNVKDGMRFEYTNQLSNLLGMLGEYSDSGGVDWDSGGAVRYDADAPARVKQVVASVMQPMAEYRCCQNAS